MPRLLRVDAYFLINLTPKAFCATQRNMGTGYITSYGFSVVT